MVSSKIHRIRYKQEKLWVRNRSDLPFFWRSRWTQTWFHAAPKSYVAGPIQRHMVLTHCTGCLQQASGKFISRKNKKLLDKQQLPVSLRPFVHDQRKESTGPNHDTIEERQRCQPQETSEPGHDQGQELERQGATDGKREIGIRRQGVRTEQAVGVRATTEGVQQLTNGQTGKGQR